MRIHENIGENVLGREKTAVSPLPDAEFTSESHDVKNTLKSTVRPWAVTYLKAKTQEIFL